VQTLDIQKALIKAGYNPGTADGQMGPKTRAAILAFQQANQLRQDGIVGRQTQAILNSSSFTSGTSGTPDVSGPSSNPGTPTGKQYTAKGTGYYPFNNAMEGGFKDRQGKPLYTLQDYLAGKAPYVSVAMDSKAFPYGTKLRIPELEAKYGRPIEFRVVDTGGAFRGKGTSRIDICTANNRASLDPTINGKLTLQVVR
jgi:peptidoglycan hydrolase-like protein with peptidoglycan-binding domain